MKRILIDQQKCEGCKSCTLACMQAHRKTPGTLYDLDLLDPQNEARHRIALGCAPGKIPGKGGYFPVFCRHCSMPDCVGACMSGALKKEPDTGHIQYDEKRCGSCFMCVMSCPYGNVKPDKVTRSKALKCDFCVNDGGEPNCVKACPKKAIHVEEVYGGGAA
jgi:carbon-monoxide dehydrogenase iron sulfur subunit